MEDSINNLGIVTSDKDVNDLAARHCEDAQVRFVNVEFDSCRSFYKICYTRIFNHYSKKCA